jgi:hypothetical protein
MKPEDVSRISRDAETALESNPTFGQHAGAGVFRMYAADLQQSNPLLTMPAMVTALAPILSSQRQLSPAELAQGIIKGPGGRSVTLPQEMADTLRAGAQAAQSRQAPGMVDGRRAPPPASSGAVSRALGTDVQGPPVPPAIRRQQAQEAAGNVGRALSDWWTEVPNGGNPRSYNSGRLRPTPQE